MLQALALLLTGDAREAAASLARALESTPEVTGYRRLFVDEGAPMDELLRRVAAGSGRRRAGRRAHPTSDVRPRRGRSRRRPPVLSERELQVLRLLDSELSGPEIAAGCSSRRTRCAPTPSTSSPSSTSPAAGPPSCGPANAACSDRPGRDITPRSHIIG